MIGTLLRQYKLSVSRNSVAFVQLLVFSLQSKLALANTRIISAPSPIGPAAEFAEALRLNPDYAEAKRQLEASSARKAKP